MVKILRLFLERKLVEVQYLYTFILITRLSLSLSATSYFSFRECPIDFSFFRQRFYLRFDKILNSTPFQNFRLITIFDDCYWPRGTRGVETYSTEKLGQLKTCELPRVAFSRLRSCKFAFIKPAMLIHRYKRIYIFISIFLERNQKSRFSWTIRYRFSSTTFHLFKHQAYYPPR